MSTDVVQLATLIVMILVLITLLVAVSVLSRMDKALRSFGSGTEIADAGSVEAGGAEAAPAAVAEAEPRRRSFRRRQRQEPAEEQVPAAEQVASEQEPAALQEPAAEQEVPPEQALVAQQAERAVQPAATAQSQESYEHPLDSASQEEADARASATAQPTPAATPERPSLAELPQEEPFERNGRWWFVRGNELLVYEEGTGEWVPGDINQLAGAPAIRAATPQGATEGGATTEMEAVEQRAESQGGWKCPSCGAINGSTAPTCRMCFTPRP